MSFKNMNKSKKDFFAGVFLFVLDMLLFYYLWKNNLFLTSALLVISVFLLLFWTNNEEKFLYAAGFFLGPIYDITLVPNGIWEYGNPTIFGVPIWLPPAYGISIVAMVKIGKAIHNFFQKR